MKKSVLKVFSVALVITLFAAMFATPAADLQYAAAETRCQAPAAAGENEARDAPTAAFMSVQAAMKLKLPLGNPIADVLEKDKAGFSRVQKCSTTRSVNC